MELLFHIGISGYNKSDFYFYATEAMMSHISSENLVHLSRLAKIAISKNNEAVYLQSLNRLLETLSLLEKVDVSENDLHPRQEEVLLTNDCPASADLRSACEKNAPQTVAHFYTVPQVIE